MACAAAAAAWLVAVSGFLPLQARAADSREIESRYQLAVTQYYQVQHDATGSVAERAARWHAVAQTFQRISRDAPHERRGGDAAFSAAIALRESWLLSQSAQDATDAMNAFRAFTAAYPEAPLVEDSMMHEAALLETQPDGSQAAYELYRKVAMRTPPGPQAALARARLNALLREQRTQSDSNAAAHGPGRAGAEAVPLTLDAAPTATPASAEAITPKASPRTRNKSELAEIRRIQVLSALQFTRVIITTDRPVKPKVEQSAGAQGQLKFDFKRTRAAKDLAVPQFVADGVLQKAAFILAEGKQTQLVLNVGPLDRYELKTFDLPIETKLVIDLYPEHKTALAAAVAKAGDGKRKSSKRNAGQPGADPSARLNVAPPLAQSASEADRVSLKASLGLKVRTIMIDPGHGGHDPGAIAFGVQEKDVALEIAKRLKTIIEKRHPDVRVGMTRDDDRFIPLARRPKLAKAFGADLFVSIHLNASPAERLQGVETYFLNLTSDSSALAVAARENATSEKKVSDLNVILLDLLRDTNILESSKLAQALHTELVDTLKEETPVKDLGVKQAPFMVLLGAEMPSVLVEAGFMTNRGENDRLKTGEYLDRIANGIYAGLDRYISSEDIAQANTQSHLVSRSTN